MKYKFNIILLVALIFTACGKEEISEDQAGSFIKFFGNSWADTANDLVQLEDGSYVILGTTTTGNGDTDVALVGTDRYGNKTWTQFFGNSGDDRGNALIKTADGSLLLCGSYQNPTTDQRNVYLIKTDMLGKEIWAVDTLGSYLPGNMEAFDMVETPDGYMLTGEMEEAGLKTVIGIRTDLQGRLNNDTKTWVKPGDYEGVNNRGSCIIKHPNEDSYIVVGTTSLEQTDAGRTGDNIVIATVLPGGSFAPPEPYGEGGNDAGSVIRHISGNEFVLAGTLDRDGNSLLYLAKMQVENEVITPLWEKTIETAGRSECMDLTLSADGGFAILASTQVSATNSDILLAVTDAEGKLIESTTYGGSGNEYAGAIYKTWDGYAICGSTGIPEDDNRMMTLIKVLDSGEFR